MKYAKNILLVICFATFAFAQNKNAAPPVAKAAPGPVTIPKDAVEIEPGLFQANDAAGKVWHYTRTPFGVRRFEPQNHEDTTAAEAARIMVDGEDANGVRFERKTPFGSTKWSRKKGDLNAAEKMALERHAGKKDERGPATAAAKPAAGK